MTDSPLITSWTEYAAVAGRLLGQAQHTIEIFDHDLLSLQLDRPAQIAALSGFLRKSPMTTLRIAVHHADALRNRHPRVLELLRNFAHKFHVLESPPHLANLSDSMLIVDHQSALIRFHHDHARSKEISDTPEACKPYVKRFEEIWAEGGTSIAATATGL